MFLLQGPKKTNKKTREFKADGIKCRNKNHQWDNEQKKNGNDLRFTRETQGHSVTVREVASTVRKSKTNGMRHEVLGEIVLHRRCKERESELGP